MTHLMGLRTFVAGIVAILALVIGLALLDPAHRHEAFFAFAGGVVGALGVLGAKSIGTSAVAGDGLGGGLKNLWTDKKPGEPPAPGGA